MPKAAKVYLTRPENQAQAWLLGLKAAGFDAENIPLLDIQPVGGEAKERIREIWAKLGNNQVVETTTGASAGLTANTYLALMFVSRAAVEHFFALKPAGVPFQPMAWCTGPGTRQALLEQGVAEAQIVSPKSEAEGGSYDSEGLWQALVSDARIKLPANQGQTVLFVRGGDASGNAKGRDWMEQTVLEHGFSTETCVAYLRIAKPLTSYPEGGTWVFSSSMALAVLPTRDWGEALALVTHPRIARKAEEKGFKRIQVCTPVLTNVVCALQSLA